MKATLCSLLLLLGGIAPLAAQIPTMPLPVEEGDSIDQVQYRVYYRLDFVSDTEDRDYVIQDIVRLDIGSKHSKEYSWRLYQADSVAKSAREMGKLPRWVNDLVPPIVLYKAYPSVGNITVDYRLPSKAPVMTYTEKKPILAWQILSERKELLNFHCQKAEITWAGRHWVAWFTPDVPLPEGPYKFGGLPGLIVELYDTDKDYHYTCTGFEKGLGEEKMLRWRWEQRPTTREELDKIVRRLYANPEQALKALGTPTRFAGDAMLDLPYNPIEK